MMNIEMAVIKPLCSLSEGEIGEIVQVRGKPDVHRYLYGKGLTMGRMISVDNAGVISGNACLTVRSGGKTATLEKEMAHNIKVRVA